MERHPKPRSLTIPATLAQLQDAAQVIARRGGLNKSELKRLPEVVAALSSPGTSDAYEVFLRKVFDTAGPQMATLCAVGLGRTKIRGMKARVRVDLPFEIKNRSKSWESPPIQDIVDRFLRPGSDSSEGQLDVSAIDNTITEGRAEESNTHWGPGYVCGLTVADAQAISISGQINGQIWLQYPYDSGSPPFVTIPITPECARFYVEARPQIP